MIRSTTPVVCGHRLAMTAESAGPTPSSLYTADFSVSLRMLILPGTTCPGRSSAHALTAGCVSKSVPSISRRACLCLAIGGAPAGGPVCPAGREGLLDGGRHVRAHLYEPAVLDSREQVAVRERAQPVGDQEGGPSAHQALHSFHDPGLGPHIDGTRRLVEDEDG